MNIKHKSQYKSNKIINESHHTDLHHLELQILFRQQQYIWKTIAIDC